MRKSIIFLFMILIFFASIGIGYFYLNTREDQKKDNNEIIVQNIPENEIISIENKEDKISPNAEITETIYYKKCGHEIITSRKVDKELINLSKEELRNKYQDYIIDTFEPTQIALYKEENKICNEHYYIGEERGMINIYKINEEGIEELYETTSILIDYFPEEEQEEIRNKKEVIGKEDLYKILENLES